MNNRAILCETLDIIGDRCYILDGRRCCLKLQPEAYQEAIYLSPERVAELKADPGEEITYFTGRCAHPVTNRDSFTAAREMAAWEWYQYDAAYACEKEEADPNRVLVLNFANPFNPGGGVRHGAQAQEEDLCRKSTLLASLESPGAAPFYTAHRASASPMASDAILLSPGVEIFRGTDNELLAESLVVSVLTCAAPMVNSGLRPSKDRLEKLLYDRIMGILHTAASYRYHYLVLGAWGCGAFGNDADQVARLFYQALKDFRRGVYTEKDCFRCVEFAVLDRSPSQYNFSCFQRQFEDFYAEDDAKKREKDHLDVQRERAEREPYRDKIRGGMLGGAVGDALGYPVEFLSWHSIQARYG